VPGSGVVAALEKLETGGANNLLGKQQFGDCEVQLEFLLGKGSNSGVKLQQRYEIQLFDSLGSLVRFEYILAMPLCVPIRKPRHGPGARRCLHRQWTLGGRQVMITLLRARKPMPGARPCLEDTA